MPTSCQPEVHVEGDPMSRWTLVRDSRAVPSSDLVNYVWEPATRTLLPVVAPA